MIEDLEKMLDEMKKELGKGKVDKEEEKKAKKEFKKAIDNADTIVGIVSADNDSDGTCLIVGRGINTLGLYGILTETMIRQTSEESVRAALEAAIFMNKIKQGEE